MPYKDPEKIKAAKQRSAAKHRERENAKRLARYHAHTPEERAKFVERQRNSRRNNPEKALARVKRYQKRNEERLIEYRAEHYKEGGKELKTEYRRQNPHIYRLAGIRSRCRQLGIPFNLNKKWYDETYTGLCELTGISFQQRIDGKAGHTNLSASVDRIDADKGYIVGNVRWVLMCINAFRGNGTDEEMFTVAKALVQHASKC